MNKDQVMGRMEVEELAGKRKKAAGNVFEDNTLKQKGRLEEATGKARSTYGDTREERENDEKRREERIVTGQIMAVEDSTASQYGHIAW